MPRITPQHYSMLVKIFEKAGWEYLGIVGDHIQMRKEGYPRRIVIPKKKEVPVFIILNNLRTAKITRDEYLKLLNKV